MTQEERKDNEKSFSCWLDFQNIDPYVWGAFFHVRPLRPLLWNEYHLQGRHVFPKESDGSWDLCLKSVRHLYTQSWHIVNSLHQSVTAHWLFFSRNTKAAWELPVKNKHLMITKYRRNTSSQTCSVWINTSSETICCPCHRCHRLIRRLAVAPLP